MKLTLQMEDSTYDGYVRMAEQLQAKTARSVSPEELMVSQLNRFRHVHPADRVVLIEPQSRDRLEALLGGGQLTTGPDLVSKVEALAHIEIGGVRLEFSPGQMKELKHLADRNRRTITEVVTDTVKRMESQFFNSAR